MPDTIRQLAVHRSDTMRHTLRSTPLPALTQGQIAVKVEFFGLSANNVTYAALGASLPYYDFFPLDAAWSALPVWGIGTVLASESEAVAVGTRFYGYLPAASHAVLQVEAKTDHGFRVARPALPREYAFYNQYAVAGRDPLYTPDREPLMVVVRPLFLTGLLLADYLTVNARNGADAVLISSAASKTAYGLAAALRAEAPVRGLASANSLPTARSFNLYEGVDDYARLHELDRTRSFIYVDIAGSLPLRQQLSERLALRGTIAVGLTHWREGGWGGASDTETFFAPGWAIKRSKEAGLSFQAKLAQGWFAQLQSAAKTFDLVHEAGEASLVSAFEALTAGQQSPREAWVRSF